MLRDPVKKGIILVILIGRAVSQAEDSEDRKICDEVNQLIICDCESLNVSNLD